MNLSKRLNTIIEMAGAYETAADIGTDHGFVPIELVKRGKAAAVIASDVNRGPLRIAEEHIKSAGLSDRISLRLGNGLSVLSEQEADLLIIAGMGGLLIRDILKAGLPAARSAKELLLLPHTDAEAVRVFLSEHAFRITEEQMVFEDGKYYVLMKAVPEEAQTPPLSPAELRYGPCLLRTRPAVFLQYLSDQERKLAEVISEIRARNKASSTVLSEKEKALSMLKEIREGTCASEKAVIN